MVKLTLPIYYHDGKKNMLIGLNKYERMHYHPLNKMKSWYYHVVRKQLPQPKIQGEYKAHFKLYYKNPSCDAPNIVAVCEKMALDALQIHNIIEEDNVDFYKGSTWEVVGQDKFNPRIEIILMDIKI